ITIISLPDELLLCIAGSVGETAEIDAGSRAPSPLHWIISHVCRHFRNVVLDAPMLWTIIDTELSRSGSCRISELYIERSRTSKISVTLRTVPGDDGQSTDVDPKLLRLVSSHSNRIKRLALVSNSCSQEKILAPFHHTSAASLECLQLRGTRRFQFAGPSEMFISGAPLLRSLKL
ncbi:hypothetical protein C8J57DRAFT_961406, partial [Mycena rebaudengoi]